MEAEKSVARLNGTASDTPPHGTGRGTGVDDGQREGDEMVVRHVLDLQGRG